MNTPPRENWGAAGAYEQWVGRWSRPVAALFVDWLQPPPQGRWADVGCGTGALAGAILERCGPAVVAGVDRSEGYVRAATERIADARASFRTGDALALPWLPASFDVVVSGLVLNFVPDPAAMASEMMRVARPGGIVAAYVWDYAGGMQMVRRFWDVAIELRPTDAAADQAERFPICQPEALAALWSARGLHDVAVRAIEFEMVFADFDDYWTPFLGRQGSAPTYLASLDAGAQERIRETLRSRLPQRPDGSIAMNARAWGVKGRAR